MEFLLEFLSWIENTDTITWIRESSSQLGYTLYLALHTIGLVFLMGPTVIMAARVFNLIPDLPISPILKFRPLMRTGFWITAISGTVLFFTAPVSFVRNPVFVVKVASVIIGYVITNRFLTTIVAKGPSIDAQLPANARALMAWAMFFWFIGVTAGRLTAYSSRVVQQSTIAALIALGVGFAVVSVGRRMGLIGGPTPGYGPSAGKRA